LKLTREQYIRYSRQLILPEVQGEGQQKLLRARVLLVGLGGLGSPQALYLAAAGVGTLGLVDEDRVDLTNLQRQVVHSTENLGMPKTLSARDRIKALNPDVKAQMHPERLNSGNAMAVLSGYDIVVDCTDNFPARYLLNDACVFLGKPLVHGAVYRFEGQATVFFPAGGGPCYRCLFPVPPQPGSVPGCAESGVMGVLPGLVGLIQAGEVLKLILGKGAPLIGRLLFCDLMATQFQEIEIRRDPKCSVCGQDPTIRELIDYETFCGLRPERAAVGMAGSDSSEPYRAIRVAELDRKIKSGEPVLFLDVREPWERSLYPSPGHEGTSTHCLEIPLSRLASEYGSLLPHTGRDIVVCCLFGSRSQDAARFLARKGFSKLHNLEGGLEEWYLYQEEEWVPDPDRTP